MSEEVLWWIKQKVEFFSCEFLFQQMLYVLLDYSHLDPWRVVMFDLAIPIA